MSHSKTSTPRTPKRYAVKTRCIDYTRLPPDAEIDRIDIEILTGRSPSEITRLLKVGKFPLPIEAKGERKRRWRYGDVLQWLQSRSANAGGRTHG